MLAIRKNYTLTGESKLPDASGQDAIVISHSATITSDGGNSSVNTYIANQDLYDANKVEMRKEIRDFQDAVYEAEDKLAEE